MAIVGGGHNGLVCAAYLARAGSQVTVLERRSLVGGACVSEERWPGYRVSRAAYVVGLLRPRIAADLELERLGLVLLPREPASITPLRDGRSLVLGSDVRANADEIRRFSARDAEAYPRYEALLDRVARALDPLLDLPPPGPAPRSPRDLIPWLACLRAGLRLGRELPHAARILVGAARDLLVEWFDSEPLRATLATDAVIGAFAAPSSPGTGYVLLHHVMGSCGGRRGVWAYVQGGMGELSETLAKAVIKAGGRIRTDAAVERIHVAAGAVRGVVLESGEELAVDAVVSSLDPRATFQSLVEPGLLPDEFARGVRGIDLRSPVVKLNLALRALPRFRVRDRDALPLSGTIHVGAESLDALERAFEDARAGEVSAHPLVELTIPSLLDPTLAPAGRHVASIFAQYAPALDAADPRWPALRDAMRDRALAAVDELAPGFSDSIEHLELLAAPDLEREFGLSGGNIFHGAMTPDRLFAWRPLPGWSRYRTPIRGLYLCGAGTHPGGGVSGACGRNAALEILRERR